MTETQTNLLEREPKKKLPATARLVENQYRRPLWRTLVILRAKHGDQRPVAEELGVTRQTLGNWLTKYYGCGAEELAAAAEAYKEGQR